MILNTLKLITNLVLVKPLYVWNPPVDIANSIRISGTFSPTSALDRFPTHSNEYQFGGCHQVRTVGDRDAIPTERKQVGMLCFCLDTDTYYILEDDLTTWTGFAGGGSSKEHWYHLSFIDETQVSVINVLKHPTFRLYAPTTTEYFVHNIYNARLEVEGHIGFGFAYNYMVDLPEQVSALPIWDSAFYSPTLKRFTMNFTAPTTGVLAVNWTE